MDIKYILKELVRSRGDFSSFLKERIMGINMYGYRSVPIDTEMIRVDGVNYDLSTMKDMYIWEQVKTEYLYDDLRSSDILLDIGANIGLFSLGIYNKVAKVVAVEPLFIEELKRNIELNCFNIVVLPYALSNTDIDISFGSKKGIVKGKTLTELIELAGGHVDFLKCDCEGGEWSIRSEELTCIRRIEAEVHSFNGEDLDSFVSMLELAGYEVKVSHRQKNIMMVHAFR